MRVLLDEDLDVRLRNHFPENVEVVTVEYMGWKGLRPRSKALVHLLELMPELQGRLSTARRGEAIRVQPPQVDL